MILRHKHRATFRVVVQRRGICVEIAPLALVSSLGVSGSWGCVDVLRFG